MLYLVYVCVLLIGYLVGSIPTGYWIVKHKTGIDIREKGSGSTGATNVSRVLGKKWFFIVMFLDMLKGFLPVLAMKLFMGDDFCVVCMAFGLIIGHSRSCFLKGKGGKSVAIGLGILFALNWFSGVIVFMIWAMIVQIFKYVSVGSMVAFVIAPIVLWICSASSWYVWYCIIASAYIIYRHQENIHRLLKHQENKISWENKHLL
jgi:glycerol-3-phosphate acyltransferase PlsY